MYHAKPAFLPEILTEPNRLSQQQQREKEANVDDEKTKTRTIVN